MSRGTCRRPNCDNNVGEQNHNNYCHRKYCSIQCELKYKKRNTDAQAAESETQRERHHDNAPRHGSWR